MSEYIKKWKDSIKGIKENIGGSTDLDNLLTRIQDLEQWKNTYADPNIQKNIDEIRTLLSQSQYIQDNIQYTLLPQIQDAQTKANTALNQIPIAVNNAKNELTNYTDTTKIQIEDRLNNVVLPDIYNKLLTNINSYVQNNIIPPITKMKDIFVNLGKGLKSDIDTIVYQASQLATTLKNESKNIQNEFVGFGEGLKTESEGISNAIYVLATQMSDAVNEINAPLSEVTYQLKVAAQRANNLNYLGAIIAVVRAVEVMVWRGARGQSSVLIEVIEALLQIGRAFNNLNVQFHDFGGMVKYRSDRITNQFDASEQNITNSITGLTASLKGLFDNMADRIQGGSGKVLKAIEYQQIAAQQIAVYETSEEILSRESAEAAATEEAQRLTEIEAQKAAAEAQITIEESQNIAEARKTGVVETPTETPVETPTEPTPQGGGRTYKSFGKKKEFILQEDDEELEDDRLYQFY